MDIHKNCVWKNKKIPEYCTHPNCKDHLCHCNLEFCELYTNNIFKLLKIKFKNRRRKKWLNLKKLKIWKKKI